MNRYVHILWLAGLVLAAACARGPNGLRSLRLTRYRPPSATTNGTDQAAGDVTPGAKVSTTRRLESGDAVMIVLLGIPDAEPMKFVIDELGSVSLEYIGRVKVSGLTAAEAARAIKRTYVARGIYKADVLTVNVIPPTAEFFVQGQVRRPGGFPTERALTLMQAIARAGGFNEFANKKKVVVRRREQILYFNCEAIERGRADDPLIEAGDVIVVNRGWL